MQFEGTISIEFVEVDILGVLCDSTYVEETVTYLTSGRNAPG